VITITGDTDRLQHRLTRKRGNTRQCKHIAQNNQPCACTKNKYMTLSLKRRALLMRAEADVMACLYKKTLSMQTQSVVLHCRPEAYVMNSKCSRA